MDVHGAVHKDVHMDVHMDVHRDVHMDVLMDVLRDVLRDVPRDAGCLPRLTTRTTIDTINDYDLPRPLINFPGIADWFFVCFVCFGWFWSVVGSFLVGF